MQDVNVLDEHGAKNEAVEKFDPGAYSKKIFGMYGGVEELVTIECREHLAGPMIDRFGTEPLFTKTDFGFKFSVRVMVSPTFFSWVLGFGEDIRITAPQNVKIRFKENLRKIAENY